MTNLEVMQAALRRVGLNVGSSTFKDGARTYLNMVGKDVQSREKWNWMFKASTFATVDGTQTYSLASDAITPLSFRNTTENHVIIVMSSQDLDAADPDHSVSGDPRWAVLDGVDSSGYVQISLYPKPDSADTIAYRYYSLVPDFTESNDADSLDGYYSPIVQPALVYGIASLYKEEKGDDQGAMSDRQEMERVLAVASRQNANVQGNRTYRMRRSDDRVSGQFSYYPQESTLT
jgi:hypothetical protein